VKHWAVENPYKAATLGGALISLFPAWFVTQMVRAFPSLQPEELEIVSEFFSTGIGPLQLILFAIVVFVVPPAEELVFRRWIWKLFNWKLTPYWTWIVVSVLFAAFHMEPLHIMGLLPFSFFLGWLRLKTGDINASVLAHMVNNAVGCLIMVI
tara:strand:+ start:1063 stop:1521 length:459 start_codon:yes stop_codon:yes gene_type:complete